MVFFLIFYFFLNFSSLAVIVAEVEVIDPQRKAANSLKELNVSQEKIIFSQYIRITFFDTEKQRFLDQSGHFPGVIYYLLIPQAKEELFQNSLNFPDWFALNYSHKQEKLETWLDCSNFNLKAKDHIIRWEGKVLNNALTKLDLSQVNIRDETREMLNVYVPEEANFPLKDLGLTDIKNFFLQHGDKSKIRNKFLSAWYGFFFSQQLQEIKNKSLLPFQCLDETALNITMQWLGFSKRIGEYKRKKDFYGIYSKENILFFALPKLSKSGLDTSLNQLFDALPEQIEYMKDYGSSAQITTNLFIENQLKNNLENIYLLAYVLKRDGVSKILCQNYKKPQEELNLKIEENPIPPENTQDFDIKAHQHFQESGFEPVPYLVKIMKSLGLDEKYTLIKKESLSISL